MTEWTVEPGDELIYGALGDTEFGAVVPRRYSTQLEAQLTANTWGELRARVPANLAREVAEMRAGAEDGDPPPSDDERYDPQDIFGWGDGDYPDWPQQRMLDFLPDDLIERYGAEETSVHNGEFFELPVEHLDALAKDLEERGYRCTRDDRLVSLVSRYEPDGAGEPAGEAR